MGSLSMYLSCLCLVILCCSVYSQESQELEKGRELITKVFHQQNIKFRCKFSIFLTKNNDVSLRLSSVACWPRRRRGISVETLELRGKKGLYVTSFTINPTRLRLLAKKTSFACPGCTVGPQTNPFIQNLATFAANHKQFPFPPLQSNCNSTRTAEVLDYSPQSLDGTNYTLTMSVSALFGSSCNLVLTSVCHQVIIATQVSALCQGDGQDQCQQLLSPHTILCRRGSIRPIT